MATIRLPSDFKEFLKSLNAHDVHYLIVGGYAVGYHGYPRATIDLDVWIDRDPRNAERLVRVVREFGFDVPDLSPDVFMADRKIVRLGRPPLRIEVMTAASGIEFRQCYERRVRAVLDEVPADFISLPDLRRNKRAAGRNKDINDLENLPGLDAPQR